MHSNQGNFWRNLAALYSSKDDFFDFFRTEKVGNKFFISSSLFENPLEKLNLAIPFIWIPLFIIELFFQPSLYSRGSDMFWNFVRNILFLNTIHVLLTYIMIFRSVEISAWLKGNRVFRKLNLMNSVVLVQILFITFFVVQRTSFPMSRILDYSLYAGILVSFVLFGLKVHHSLSQVRFLARLYDTKYSAKVNVPGNAELMTKRAQKVEQRLFFLLIASFFLIGSVWYAVVGEKLPFEYSNAARILSFILCIPCVGILVNFFRYPRPWNINKFIYLLRLSAVPLFYITPVTTLVMSSCHGMEYWCIYSTTKKKSVNGVQWMGIATWILFILAVVLLLTPYAKMPVLSWIFPDLSSFSSSVLIGVSVSLSFTHYYIDALLIKMVRSADQEISPLESFLKSRGEKAETLRFHSNQIPQTPE